jgi:glycosyltransferase involved in cell wall biosynthesis
MLKNLQKMNHHVVTVSVCAVEKMVREIEATGAEFIAVPEMKNMLEMKRTPYFPIIAGYRQIERIAKEKSIDVIHAQDFHSIMRAFLAAIRLRKGFVFTQPGGPNTPKMGPKKTDTVLFSQENMDYHKQAGKENLHLIRARIDTTEYYPAPAEGDFIEKGLFPASGRKIVMAVRLFETKRASLKSVVEAARIFAEMPEPPRICVAGEGPMLSELLEESRQINIASAAGPVLRFIGPIFKPEEMARFYNYSDLVIGSGRGILEAMACGKPVVILGENYEAEIVGPDNIEEIAYYNFSGRHLRARKMPSETLSDLLLRLVKDTDQMRRLGEYCLDYITTKMDARLGAAQLVEVYTKAIERKSVLTDLLAWYIDTMYHSLLETTKKRIFAGRI